MADHYVFFGAEIGPASANNFIALLLQLIPQAPDCVVIAMNSSGGGVVPGIAMYNQMLAMPYPIVTHNVGNVDSIATAVFVGATSAMHARHRPSCFMVSGLPATPMSGWRKITLRPNSIPFSQITGEFLASSPRELK